jgi:hypothetical protein
MTQQPLALKLADSAEAYQLTVHDCSLVAKELRRLHGLAQRQWVGLTDEERDEICLGDEGIARAIEAKLKEKNT